MKYSDNALNDIFDRTNGRCHICGRTLAFSNYARFGRRGAWEVEHALARVRGGTDRLSNLYAACVTCNRSKGAGATRRARARHGRTRAPHSRRQVEEMRTERALLGGVFGAYLGSRVGGAVGALAGGIVGLELGYAYDPDLR